MSKSIQERLSFLQKNLKVEKGQQNKFGGYAYRSSEDILEALKPLLEDDETVTVDEEMFALGDGPDARFYKRSVAIFTKGDHVISKSAVTREDANQKGMSLAQLSGSVGSYGKKYALGNLFAIDDTKDADATNDHGKKAPEKPTLKKASNSKTSFRRKKKAVETQGDDDDI